MERMLRYFLLEYTFHISITNFLILMKNVWKRNVGVISDNSRSNGRSRLALTLFVDACYVSVRTAVAHRHWTFAIYRRIKLRGHWSISRNKQSVNFLKKYHPDSLLTNPYFKQQTNVSASSFANRIQRYKTERFNSPVRT